MLRIQHRVAASDHHRHKSPRQCPSLLESAPPLRRIACAVCAQAVASADVEVRIARWLLIELSSKRAAHFLPSAATRGSPLAVTHGSPSASAPTAAHEPGAARAPTARAPAGADAAGGPSVLVAERSGRRGEERGEQEGHEEGHEEGVPRDYLGREGLSEGRNESYSSAAERYLWRGHSSLGGRREAGLGRAGLTARQVCAVCREER
eukprot:6969927-Prymnesium_polylepis.3